MPQAIPIIAIAISSALKLSAAWTAVIGLAASAATTLLTSRSEDKSHDPTTGTRLNSSSTSIAYPVVYGTMRVGGNRVFLYSGGANNNTLWMVHNLAEGECDGIAEVGGVPQIWLGDKLYTAYGIWYDYWFYNGSSIQVYNDELHTAYPAWTDNKRNVCYVVHKLLFNSNMYQGLPNITYLLNGRRLYDFRTGLTAWSDNPVLALYDWETNKLYGKGKDTTTIDIASWTATANYCDLRGFKINMNIGDLSKSGEDVSQSIRDLFHGRLNWWNGQWYLRYSDLIYESSVMTLTDEHIIQNEDGSAEITVQDPGPFDVPDGLKIRFLDKALDYVESSILIGEDSESTEEIVLDGCTDRLMGRVLGASFLERKQLSRNISLQARGDALRLEPGDPLTLYSTALGISGQITRVAQSNLLTNGNIALSLMYESLSLTDNVYDLELDDVYTCSLADLRAEPPSVENVAVTEEQYMYRDRTFTKLLVDFNPPTNYPWFDHVEVRISYDDVTWTYLYNVSTEFEILNIKEDQDCYIRLKVVSMPPLNKSQEDINDYKIHYRVLGYTTAPSSITSLDAVVNQNSINLYAARVASPDIELYEFRVGASWIGGIVLGSQRAPNLSLFGVKPGEHTFWINTLSNNKKYGITPQSATVSLIDPPDGWAVQETETCDYNAVGTHSNTEHVTYDGDDYLKCSHTSSVLTGVYTSPVYDLLASERYLVYALASIVVSGVGTTWEDIGASSEHWSDVGVTTRRWSEIFEPFVSGPQVQMRLLYGDSNPPLNSVGRLEILSAVVTGRYFQLEITVIDPSPEVNALIENFTLKFCQ